MYGSVQSQFRHVNLFPTSLRLFNVGLCLSPVFVVMLVELMGTNREFQHASSSLCSTVLMGMVCSEALLFVSLFWTGINQQITTGIYHVGATVPSPSQVGMVMTIVLSALCVTVCKGTVQTQNGVCFGNGLLMSHVLTYVWIFSVLLVSEYLGMSLSINDQAFCSVLMVVTALHFGHVLLGGFLVFVHVSAFIDIFAPDILLTPHRQFKLVSGHFDPWLIVYFHFIEAVWLCIYAINYL